MKKLYKLVLAFAILLSTAVAFATDVSVETGLAKTKLTLSRSDSVDASVETIRTPNEYIYSKAFMWGGDEATPPKSIVRTLTVSRNGEKVFIPVSAYSDLGTLRSISLNRVSEQRFQLVVRGGDAAGSYVATLEFKGKEIVRRKVLSGEFPKEVWEATTYSFNHLNN